MESLQDRIGRFAVAAGIAVVAAALAAAAAGFAFTALFLAVEEASSPQLAALVVAAAALLAALLLAWLARRIAAGPARLRRGVVGKPVSAIPMMADLAANAASAMPRVGPAAVVAALACGFALGASARLRRALWRAVG